jgi:tetratricopeptide (TPR) repeat protein
LSWFRDAGETELGLRLATALWRFWRTNNHLVEGARVLDEYLAATETESSLRARALLGAARLAMDRGDVVQALAYSEDGLLAAQSGGDPRDIAAATENVGLMQIVSELTGSKRQPGLTRGVVLLEESVARFQALGDDVGAADALNNLGNALIDAGEPAKAADALEEALALQREGGNALGLAFVLNTLGYVALRAGKLDRAGERLEESLRLFHELGDVSRTGDTLEGLAELAARRGEDHRAATLWGAGEKLRAVSGKEMEPSERALREDALELVRARLGQADMAEAWAGGAALKPADAVALALSTAKTSEMGP